MEQAGILPALFCMVDKSLVFWRPKLVQQAGVQVVVGQRVRVINKDSVVLPKEMDLITCIEAEVFVGNLQKSLQY